MVVITPWVATKRYRVVLFVIQDVIATSSVIKQYIVIKPREGCKIVIPLPSSNTSTKRVIYLGVL